MHVSFKELKVGQAYDRQHLADLWKYKGYHAIAREISYTQRSTLYHPLHHS